MKILGFTLDNKCDMSAHVLHIIRKVNMRIWMLIHLKKATLPDNTLVAVYKTLIRSIIEYACQAYNSMLTIDQSGRLEALQRRSLRIITGPGISYRLALEELDIPHLSTRREQLCLKFANRYRIRGTNTGIC